MQRIEVCQGMNGTTATEMADIAAFGKGYDPDLAMLDQVLSKPNDDDTGTKGCNGDCHLHGKGERLVGDTKIHTGVNDGLLSTPVPPDVNNVIFTTDPAVQAAIKEAKDGDEYEQRKGTRDEDLASICKCIDENKGKAPFTEESGKLALALCNALLSGVEGAGGGADGAGGASGRGSVGGTSGVGGGEGGGEGGVGGEGGAGGEGGGTGVDSGISGAGGTQSNHSDSGTAAGSGGFVRSFGVFAAR
jgi:hypothetical protein